MCDLSLLRLIQTHTRVHGLDGELQRIESAIDTTYSHDPAGQLTGQHHWSQINPAQNDTQTTWTLDAAGRLAAIQQTETPPTGNLLTDTLIYGYDLNGILLVILGSLLTRDKRASSSPGLWSGLSFWCLVSGWLVEYNPQLIA